MKKSKTVLTPAGLISGSVTVDGRIEDDTSEHSIPQTEEVSYEGFRCISMRWLSCFWDAPGDCLWLCRRQHHEQKFIVLSILFFSVSG